MFWQDSTHKIGRSIPLKKEVSRIGGICFCVWGGEGWSGGAIHKHHPVTLHASPIPASSKRAFLAQCGMCELVLPAEWGGRSSFLLGWESVLNINRHQKFSLFFPGWTQQVDLYNHETLGPMCQAATNKKWISWWLLYSIWLVILGGLHTTKKTWEWGNEAIHHFYGDAFCHSPTRCPPEKFP